jgi:hypothetical protein
VESLEVYVREQAPPTWVGTNQDEPYRMTDRFEHRTKQDRQIVAIARAQFQQSAR